jgi:hypothetical protein
MPCIDQPLQCIDSTVIHFSPPIRPTTRRSVLHQFQTYEWLVAASLTIELLVPLLTTPHSFIALHSYAKQVSPPWFRRSESGKIMERAVHPHSQTQKRPWFRPSIQMGRRGGGEHLRHPLDRAPLNLKAAIFSIWPSTPLSLPPNWLIRGRFLDLFPTSC